MKKVTLGNRKIRAADIDKLDIKPKSDQFHIMKNTLQENKVYEMSKSPRSLSKAKKIWFTPKKWDPKSGIVDADVRAAQVGGKTYVVSTFGGVRFKEKFEALKNTSKISKTPSGENVTYQELENILK